MASLTQLPSTMSAISLPRKPPRTSLKHHKSLKFPNIFTFNRVRIQLQTVCCTKTSPFEPSPITYAPTPDSGGNFLKGTSNIFETLKSDEKTEIPSTDQSTPELHFLKWPMWVLGPSLLLVTGMVPTLWLPISSIFLGPNIASLLSLTGLDCIFNLGASLFLLMADFSARSNHHHPPPPPTAGKPPLSYRFWNVFATIIGFSVPLTMLFFSRKGFFQAQLPFVSFAVLMGPYLLLLGIQMLTEMLTWHWESPVWLVTPVVYEGYRILQLMRGLKLGAELSAPAWMMHTVRGLVCWWVLILGMQLMRVAWFAGFATRFRRKSDSDEISGDQ